MQEYIMYLRKSRQDNPNETIAEVLARHEKQLQEYSLKTFGYRISEENIYREIVSGETIEDRPQINAVFKRMESSDIKGVLVIEPQRLTRGDLLDCGTVVHLFRYSNTLIVTPTKTYNLSDKFDRKFFEMELSRGNDYLEYTKEILERGRKASQREGNYIGSIAPYGYDRVKIDKSWTLAINESEAKYVRLAFEMYIDGHGAQVIAKRLNELGAKPRHNDLFQTTVIRQMLQNPIYIGKIKMGYKTVDRVYENGKLVKKRKRNYECELIDGKHEAIISEETFNKAKERKGKSTREKTSRELQNPFASIIKCKKCGSAIMQQNFKKDGVEYRKQRYFCRNINCSNKSANADIVNEVIVSTLKRYLNDFKVKIENNTNEIETTQKALINSLENELARLETRQEELYDYLEKKVYTIDVFKVRNEKLAMERERLQKSLAIAKTYIPTISEYKEKYASLHKAIELLEDKTVSAKTKNNFLKEVIDTIYYEKDVATPNVSDDRNNIIIDVKLK